MCEPEVAIKTIKPAKSSLSVSNGSQRLGPLQVRVGRIMWKPDYDEELWARDSTGRKLWARDSRMTNLQVREASVDEKGAGITPRLGFCYNY